MKKVLIVDDQRIQRIILRDLLENLGYDIIEASNGLEGLESFIEHAPNMVFMDVVMPVMDGYESARKIKETDTGRFTPIIFLTGLDDPDSIKKCIESGGDDFLSKPVNPFVLNVRIIALERICDLYNTLHEKHDAVLFYIEQEKINLLMAKKVLEHALFSRNIQSTILTKVNLPAASFSGDVILNGCLPNGVLRVLVADFTGHGLAAAMLSLPVSEVFHTMTRRGCEQTLLLTEINNKLLQLLPDDRFMAATILDIDPNKKEIILWSGGMPACIFIQNNESILEIPAKGLPMGILAQYDFSSDQVYLNYCKNSLVLIQSDGFQDARNEAGLSMVQTGNYDAFINAWRMGDADLHALTNEFIQKHCQSQPQDDDVTFVEINFSKVQSNS